MGCPIYLKDTNLQIKLHHKYEDLENEKVCKGLHQMHSICHALWYNGPLLWRMHAKPVWKHSNQIVLSHQNKWHKFSFAGVNYASWANFAPREKKKKGKTEKQKGFPWVRKHLNKFKKVWKTLFRLCEQSSWKDERDPSGYLKLSLIQSKLTKNASHVSSLRAHDKMANA